MMHRKLTGKEKKIILAIVLALVAVFIVYSLIRLGKDDGGGNASETLQVADEVEMGSAATQPTVTEDPTDELPFEESVSTLPPQTDPPDLYGPTLPPQTDPPGFWDDLTATETQQAPQTDPPETAAPTQESGIYVTQSGTYTDKEGVAQYLHTYGKLPSNFITKKQAENLGWSSGKNLNSYAPGKSIGGDYFSNYEGVPGKGTFHECDINYHNGKRGAERIVWSGDGRIFYTPDHYTTYYEWKGPNNWVYAYTYHD